MKINLLIFLIIPVICFSQKKEGQPLLDSLLVELPKMKEDTLKVNLLNDLAFNYKFIDANSHFKYAKNALNLSSKINYYEGIAKSKCVLGVYFVIKNDLINAKTSFNEALKFAKNKKTIAQIYSGLSTVFEFEGNYPKALEYANKGLVINEIINNKINIAKSYINIAAIYIELENYNKALEFNSKALNINKIIKNTSNDNVIYSNSALCYKSLNQVDKAIEYFNKAIEIDIKSGNKTNLSYCYGGLSALYFEKKNYEKVLFYVDAAKKINIETDNQFNYAQNQTFTAKVYLEYAKIETNQTKKNDFVKTAKLNIEQALVINKKLNSIKDLSNNYNLLSQVQKLQGNYKESLQLFELSTKYNDSIFNSDNKETIKNLEDKREIELRDKQLKINQLSLQAKEKQKWLYLAGLGFLAIIGSLLFYQNRKRKQINQKLSVLNENLDKSNGFKNKVLGILNHDLRSPVNNFIHYMQLKNENPELLTPESKARIENETLSAAENLLNSMENILLWSKNQMKNFEPKLSNVSINQIFEDTKNHFSSIKNVTIHFENLQNLEIISDENYLKTIIRNLTGNAIKASEHIKNVQINWKCWQSDNINYLSITDHAGGATPEQLAALYDDSQVVGTQAGLGLHLIRDLAKAINCEITVDSIKNVGTTFILKL